MAARKKAENDSENGEKKREKKPLTADKVLTKVLALRNTQTARFEAMKKKDTEKEATWLAELSDSERVKVEKAIEAMS